MNLTPGRKILVTGSTGYVGGRLVSRLIEKADCEIRVFVRDASRIAGRGWRGLEICEGDALNLADVKRAVQNVEVVYYLIHSMGSGEEAFSSRDQTAAENFAQAAKECGVKRIIYLGGLGHHQDENLSLHLKSRQDTGFYLGSTGIPVTEFRAGMIIGSGSLSFEMLRYLTERVPIMIAPRWIETISQPISIREVLSYLLQSLDEPRSIGKIFEIGGPEKLSYRQMIQIYARERGLTRLLIRVPILTPRLSSYWINVVTPLPASIARPLIEGLRNELVVHDHSAKSIFNVEPVYFLEALQLALQRTFADQIETRWSSALSSVPIGSPLPVKLEVREGLVTEERSKMVHAKPHRVFQAVTRIGGDAGWPYANFLWEIRGWMDRFLGGVGLRRGRRSPTDLQVGEALDFWRVEAIEENKLLRLRAEMKVPGKAWLEFTIQEEASGSFLTQRAIFEPKGLFGLLYWYSIYPLHGIIFRGMINALAKSAEAPQA